LRLCHPGAHPALLRQTYLAILARILPYYVSTELPKQILTRDETLAELKERGLPIELIDHLRRAPEELRDGEHPIAARRCASC
jgi:hypothetical protein